LGILIARVREKYPDTVFFFRSVHPPKMMKELAKAGFSQSTLTSPGERRKQELTEYLTELTQTEMRQYFRATCGRTRRHFASIFKTGDDGLYHSRCARRDPFILWGIYSGYELCENEALPGREEYLDSEKYQFKERDWNGGTSKIGSRV